MLSEPDNTETDGQGWRYAFNFPAWHALAHEKGNNNDAGCWVRWRRWQRGTASQGLDRTQSVGVAGSFDQVYENERWWIGVGWTPASASTWPDDPTHYTSLTARPYPGPKPETGTWAITLDGSVDSDGWAYSTSFESIQHPREGGRKAQRTDDVVRRRVWARKGSKALDSARASGKLATIRKSQEEENAQAEADANATVQALLQRHLGKRSLMENIDMLDPVAWVRVKEQHATLYEKQTQKMQCKDMGMLRRAYEATLWAKAAYGYAMLKGFMDDLNSNTYMHTVQKLKLDVTTDIDAETEDGAVLEMMGIPRANLIHSFWAAATFKPAHFVAIDKEARQVILAVRGTLAPADALTDVGADCAPHPAPPAAPGGWVHNGMLKSARFVLDSSMAALREATERCRAEGGECRLTVTGHSLGAGVASTIALILRDEVARAEAAWFPAWECVALAPPAIMTLDLAVGCRDVTLSVVCGQDMIPRTSPANVDRLIHEVHIQSNRHKLLETLDLDGRAKRDAELEGLLVAAGDQDRHYPPGNLLLIHQSCVEHSPVSFQASGDFDRLLVHAEMVGDHLLPRYEAGLKNALDDATELALTQNVKAVEAKF